MIEGTSRVPVDHPCLPGHFPGNPVVPAALLLDEVTAMLERLQGLAARAWTVAGAKFLLPVRPGDELRITFAPRGSGLLLFEVSVGGRTAVSGRLRPTAGAPA